MLQERNEPRWGCFSSLKSQRKCGLGDRFKGLSQDKLPLPIVPLVENLVGPLEFSTCKPVGEEEREGKRTGVLPGGRVLVRGPLS